jgi:hypothetical protein
MIWPYSLGRRSRTEPAQIDSWLPDRAIELEHHAIDLPADTSAVHATVDQVRLKELPIVRALFRLRGLSSPEVQPTLRQFFSTPPFVALDELPGRELVFGVLGPFWQWRPGHLPTRVARSPEEFRRALTDGCMAAIGNYCAEPRAAGARLWTETWLHAPAAAQRAMFTGYWLAIGPFSAWIRRIMLREAARRVSAHDQHDPAEA